MKMHISVLHYCIFNKFSEISWKRLWSLVFFCLLTHIRLSYSSIIKTKVFLKQILMFSMWDELTFGCISTTRNKAGRMLSFFKKKYIVLYTIRGKKYSLFFFFPPEENTFHIISIPFKKPKRTSTFTWIISLNVLVVNTSSFRKIPTFFSRISQKSKQTGQFYHRYKIQI